MKKRKAPGRRRPSEQLRNNRRDYPQDGSGHTYNLRDVPQGVWGAAVEHARIQRVSLRWVLIRLLDQYAKGTVSP